MNELLRKTKSCVVYKLGSEKSGRTTWRNEGMRYIQVTATATAPAPPPSPAPASAPASAPAQDLMNSMQCYFVLHIPNNVQFFGALVSYIEVSPHRSIGL